LEVEVGYKKLLFVRKKQKIYKHIDMSPTVQL